MSKKNGTKEQEYNLLKEIAYCALGFKDELNENNFGEAELWKNKLFEKIRKYVDNDFDFGRMENYGKEK